MISSESQPKVNLKKVSVQQGFRLIIHNFLIIDDKVPEKVTLGDELCLGTLRCSQGLDLVEFHM